MQSLQKAQEEDLLNRYITLAKDENTNTAKQNKTSQTKKAIDVAHQPTLKNPTPIMQWGCNLGLTLGTNLLCTVRKIKQDQQYVTPAKQHSTQSFIKD